MPIFTLVLVAVLSGPVAPDALEVHARAIQAALIAPCCWTQQVSLHQSEASMAIRREIRESLRAGRTREQILASYRARYGTRILAEPPAEGFTSTLHVFPWVALVFSAALVVGLVRQFAGHRLPAAGDGVEAPGERMSSRLDDELRDLD